MKTMPGLTQPQQKVLALILALLLTGWAVKAWRIAHPPEVPLPEQSDHRP